MDLLIKKQVLKRGETYLPSRFLLHFLFDGTPVLFNCLTKKCYEAELPLRAYSYEEIAADPELTRLAEDNFLVPASRDETSYYVGIYNILSALTKPKGFSSYTLLLTTACNARCVYCYEQGMKISTMTEEVADALIGFIASTRDASKPVTLTWYGGEPLLKADLISHICSKLRERNIAFDSNMVTNGSLMTPELIKKAASNWRLNCVQISMDGAEEDYIARKNYYNYNDSYNRVLELLPVIEDNGIVPIIRINVDEENIERSRLLIDELARRIVRRDRVNVSISPLYQARIRDKGLELWKKAFETTLYCREKGFSSILKVGVGLSLPNQKCKGGRSGVSVSPDGGVYLCQHCEPCQRFGDVFNGITDEGARHEFLRTDNFPEKCRSCPFLPDCTPVSSCPVKDDNCRAVRMLSAETELREITEGRALFRMGHSDC